MFKCAINILVFLLAVSSVSAQCWNSGSLSDDELANLVQNNFPIGTIQATGENIQAVAFAVAKAESCGGNPTACGDCGKTPGCYLCYDNDNPSTSSIGLWQINLRWHPEYDRVSLFDPNNNARAALQISSQGQDWSPWSTYKNGAYKDHLDEATQALGLESSSQREVTLTLYVHDGDRYGPVISGALVTGRDAAGNSFQDATDSSGYVIITGDPGTWHFEVSAYGYQTNIWDQQITATDRKDAFLQKSVALTTQGSGNSIVGDWIGHVWGFSSSNPNHKAGAYYLITFNSDGTFISKSIIFNDDGTYRFGSNSVVGGECQVSTGNWIQTGNIVRVIYSDGISREWTVTGNAMSAPPEISSVPDANPPFSTTTYFEATRVGGSQPARGQQTIEQGNPQSVPESSIVGEWTWKYNWDCAGTPTTREIDFKNDGTLLYHGSYLLSDSGKLDQDESGKWTQSGKNVHWTIDHTSTVWDGTIQTNTYMSGTMSIGDSNGCWTAYKKDASS